MNKNLKRHEQYSCGGEYNASVCIKDGCGMWFKRPDATQLKEVNPKK